MSASTPIPRSTRELVITSASGQTVFGPPDFKLFDADDVAVFVKQPGWTAYQQLTGGFTAALLSTTAVPSSFTVTLAAARPENTLVKIQGKRVQERITDVTQGGAVNSVLIEREFDRESAVLQELRRDVDAVQQPGQDLDDAIAEAQGARDQAVTANATAQVAMLAAIAAAGQSLLCWPSRAAMAAVTFPVGVVAVQTLGRASAGGGGAAPMVRVGAQPAHLGRIRSTDRYLADGATIDSVNGGWWEIDRDVELTPQMLGPIEASPESDTAAMQAWADALADGYKPAPLGRHTLEIQGAIAFSNLPFQTVIDTRKATLKQQERFFQTLLFDDTCDSPILLLGKFAGFAAKELDADPGTRPSEFAYDFSAPFDPDDPDATYSPDQGHYNGVAAAAFYGCPGVVTCRGGELDRHAGGGLYAFGCSTDWKDMKSRGIGPDWIRGAPFNDNGSDFGAEAIGGAGVDATTADYTHDWSGFDIDDHAFCIGAYFGKRFHSHGHKFLRARGQHTHYCEEFDDWHVHDFHCSGAPQIGVKYQFANVMGIYGTAYGVGQAIVVGDERKSPSTDQLYVATEAFTTANFATELGAGKWVLSPKMIRRNHKVHNITFDNCGIGLGYIASTQINGIEGWCDGALISQLKATNGITGGYLQRLRGRVSGYVIEDMSDIGLFATDFGGFLQAKVTRAATNGFNATLAFATRLELELVDTGSASANAFALAATDGDTIPSHEANPLLDLSLDAGQSSGDFAASYFAATDAQYPVYPRAVRARKNIGGATPADSSRTANYGTTQA